MSLGSALALKTAASQIGYYAPDDPEPGSKYGRWAAQQLGQSWLAGPSTSVWWCMLFASWCVYTSGGTIPGGISFNTDHTLSAARSAGRVVSRANAQPGDLVIYNWDGNSTTDHVGILEKVIAAGIQTIEGNTSGSDWGSQSAGNGVHRRTRSWAAVAAIVRPYYVGGGGTGASKPAATTTAKPAPAPAASPAADGYWGSTTTRALQRVLGTPQDGVVSSQSAAWRSANTGLTSGWEWVTRPTGSTVIRALQKKIGVPADGLIGPTTIRALQKRVGTPADGVLSAESKAIAALQRRLQKGTI